MTEREHFTNGRCFTFAGGTALTGLSFTAQTSGLTHWVSIGIGYGSGLVLMLLSAIWISRSYYLRDQPLVLPEATREAAGFSNLTVEQQQPVIDRFYANEVVDLDGKNFTRCTFTNVTLRYNGTATFSISYSQFSGRIHVKSHNPAVEGAWALATAVGANKAPLLDEKGNVVRNVTSPSFRK